jgi:hypothetical protein
LKRINIHAFKFIPVERLPLKIVMNRCCFEYLSNKPGVSAIKNSFFLVAFSFVLIFDECYRGQPVGAGWTAYCNLLNNKTVLTML